MTKSWSWEKENLTWRKPHFMKREYELLLHGQLVASLRQRGWFPVQAEVFEGPEAMEPVLRVERKGWWRQKLHAKTLDYRFPQMPPADLSWRGEAKFKFDNGRSYSFHPTNFWQTQWELCDSQGICCLSIKRNAWNSGGEVVPGAAHLSPEEMRFLIYLAWNIIS